MQTDVVPRHTSIGSRVRIAKADILQGRFARVKNVEVEEWDGATVALWSLTEGQWAHIESLRLKGIGFDISGSDVMFTANREERMKTLRESGGVKLDIEQLMRSDLEADAQAVAYSLSGGDEVWTQEEVLAIRPPGIVAKLAKEVYELSGVTPENVAAIAEFRDDGTGNGAVLPDHERDAAGSVDSGADANPVPLPD